MADDKKDSSGSKPTGTGGVYLFTFLMIIFILWIITGGPQKNPESRDNQFIDSYGTQGGGQTYHDDPFGQPGSVTNKVPFLK